VLKDARHDTPRGAARPPEPGRCARLLSVLALAALLDLHSGCARRETPAEAGIRTQTLLVGNGAEPADLDPQSMSVNMDSQIA
jgi:oligopeptide transport system substrate-binding protein